MVSSSQIIRLPIAELGLGGGRAWVVVGVCQVVQYLSPTPVRLVATATKDGASGGKSEELRRGFEESVGSVGGNSI